MSTLTMNVFEFLITLVVSLVCGAIVYQSALHWRIGERLNNLAERNQLDRSRWFDTLFVLLVLVYSGVFVSLSVLRHLSANTGYDLAQYDQIIWNSLHGRLFEQTYITNAPFFLGKSFTPILLAFVPLYAIWSDPILLLVVQTVALSSVAFPLYWFTRGKAGRLAALSLVLAYFLSPVVEGVNVTDFHEIVLAAPLLAFGTWFLLRRHYKGFFVCLGVALLVKEEIALVAIMLGVYIFLFQRRRWLGLGLAAFSAILAVLLLQYVIPFLAGPEGANAFFYFGDSGRYAYLGNSLPAIAATILTRPDVVLQHLLVPAKIEFVLDLLVPLAILPLAGIEVALLALPTLGYSLLSDYYPQFSIKYPYTPPLIPFLFLAAALGLARVLAVERRVPSSSKMDHSPPVGVRARPYFWATLVIVAGGISYYLAGPGPFARNFDPSTYTVRADATEGRALAATVPHDAIVVAAGEWVSQLSERASIYNVEDPTVFRRADFLFAEQGLPWFELRKEVWQAWFSSGYFDIVKKENGFVIARRREPEIPVQVQFDGRLKLAGLTMVPNNSIAGGSSLRIILVWQAEKGIAQNYQTFVRVVDNQGHVWAEARHETDQGYTPINQSEVGRAVADMFDLKLPPTTPGGAYHISVSAGELANPDFLLATSGQGDSLGTDVNVATFNIVKNKGSFQASELWWIEQPLYVDMQEMRLIGFVPPPGTIRRGDTLPVGVYWRAREKPQGDYKVAIQLRDTTGRVAFEQVSRPANGTYPTTQWDAGEVLLDWHDLAVPTNLQTGQYEIDVEMLDAKDSHKIGSAAISSVAIGDN